MRIARACLQEGPVDDPSPVICLPFSIPEKEGIIPTLAIRRWPSHAG
jgi:hypothetical protein